MKPSDLEIDINRAEKKIIERSRCPFKFHLPTNYQEEDHYKKAREEHPSFSPDPCHYWKMKNKSVDTNVPAIAPEPFTLPNGKEAKIYYLNHQRNDFRISKPMRKSVF